MSVKERKQRERETLRQMIVSLAQDLVAKEGLESLTMRGIAASLDYSQSKIYEFFDGKDRLCEVLCEQLCSKLLEEIQKLPKGQKPERYFTSFILETVKFHASHPHSDQLFTLVCFNPERFAIPCSYLEIEKVAAMAIRNLNSPHLKTEADIAAALDVIRCFLIGMATLTASIISKKGSARTERMAENVAKILVRGWKG